MAEYVEREALIAWLKRIQLKDLSDGRGLCRVIFEEDFKHAIRTLPDGAIADVAPVVHGRWMITEGRIENAVCSNCGRHFQSYYEGYRYCPSCGAEMMGETHESEKQL